MATYSKQLLSGSTNGKNIKVVATATLGTTIHTAVSGTVNLDEIYLYVRNSDTSAAKLIIEFGGATYPDNLIEYTVQPEAGLDLIIPGLLLQNGLVVTAYSDVADVLAINGYVNRITA